MSQPLLIFRDDKLFEVTGLLMFSTTLILLSRPFIEAVNSSMLTDALNGSFGPIFYFSISLILALAFGFVLMHLFREIFNDKGLSVFANGFSFFDDDLRARVHLEWEALHSVRLSCDESNKSKRNFLTLSTSAQEHKILLDCLSNNPQDISDRMKRIYNHWKNGDFNEPSFKLPYYPNVLKTQQLFYYLVLMLVCLFVIYQCLQLSEIVVYYDEIWFYFAGMSRSCLLSAAAIGFAGVTSQFLDHFDRRDNEKHYQAFKKYSSISACLLFEVAILNCDMVIEHG